MFTQALSSNSSDFRRIKSLVFLYNRVYLYSLAEREQKCLSLLVCFLQNFIFFFPLKQGLREHCQLSSLSYWHDEHIKGFCHGSGVYTDWLNKACIAR